MNDHTPSSPAVAASVFARHPERRVTVADIHAAKRAGERWGMLTAYDSLMAGIFDAAGTPALLVGDSAGMVVFGHETTLPVTVDELLALCKAVVRGSRHAMVIADLPFGSYLESPAQALATSTRFVKEGGAGAVKVEGGRNVVPQVKALVEAGIPTLAHVGLTPQSVHTFSGFKVQGRGGDGERVFEDAKALEEAGAFAIVLEAVPVDLAQRITAGLKIATVGIGAGVNCDAQVLVWQDMLGLTTGHVPKFVKRYADLHKVASEATKEYLDEVRAGVFPGAVHGYK